MKNIAGFTLIELLVSMTLLSLVVLTGTSAFGLFAQRWDGQLGKYDAAMLSLRHFTLVQDVMDGLINYVAYDNDERPIIYFEANRNGFVGVSSRSLSRDDVFATVRFSVKQNNDLSFDVLYEEWPMVDDVLRSTRQRLDFSEPLVLFESVKNPVFEYYGWSTIEEANGDGEGEGPAPARWMQHYNGLESFSTPLKLQLTFNVEGVSYRLLSVLSGPMGSSLVSRYQGRYKKVLRSDEQGEVVDDYCYCE